MSTTFFPQSLGVFRSFVVSWLEGGGEIQTQLNNMNGILQDVHLYVNCPLEIFQYMLN